MKPDQKLLTTQEAAEVLGITASWLEKDRWRGASIPYVRLGAGKGVVRYKMEDLTAYIEARTVRPVVEPLARRRRHG